MDEQQVLAAVQQERLRLCAFLDQLGPDEWEAPSLCAGWRVREVVAHLTIPTRATVLGSLVGAVRARGNFHRMADQQARARAREFEPDELVTQLRESATSSRRMPGSSHMDPLVDVLVHGQDIAIPLERRFDGPLELVVASLDHVVTQPFTGAPARIAGLRLAATDVDWTHGSGPTVSGTAGDILLTVLGRSVALDGVTGDGVPELRDRLGASTQA